MGIYIVRGLNAATGFLTDPVCQLSAAANLRPFIVDLKIVFQTLPIVIKSTTFRVVFSVYQFLDSVVAANVLGRINQSSETTLSQCLLFWSNLRKKNPFCISGKKILFLSFFKKVFTAPKFSSLGKLRCISMYKFFLFRLNFPQPAKRSTIDADKGNNRLQKFTLIIIKM